MPTNLADVQKVDSSTYQVVASTTNFAYTGVYNVYVQCSYDLVYFGLTSVSTQKGNTFTLTVDACNSCG